MSFIQIRICKDNELFNRFDALRKSAGFTTFSSAIRAAMQIALLQRNQDWFISKKLYNERYEEQKTTDGRISQ